MAPTRELANQTAKEFMTVCPGLSVVSVYGGVSISMQVRQWEMVVGGSFGSSPRRLGAGSSRTHLFYCRAQQPCHTYCLPLLQMRDLRDGADVIVGTPGRIIDLIERKSLALDKVRLW